MIKFTDIFIKRPVLATVLSLLIFMIGLRAIFGLQLREYPKLENTVITITTTYPGASAQLVEGFITTPIEKQVAGAEGVDYMTSTSVDNVSTVTAYIKLNFDPNVAFTNVLAKVQEAKKDLPSEAQNPVLKKETGSTISLMYISFSSSQMTSEQITNYLTLAVQPKLQTIPGVASAEILGSQIYAMRVWLDPRRMAGLGVTPNDVNAALLNNNVQAAAGTTRGNYVQISIHPNTDLHTAEQFKNLVIKRGANGQLVRLKDVARVELGSEDYDSSIFFNGKKAIFMGINPSPTGNPLTIASAIKKVLPSLEANYPPSLKGKIVYDASIYISASIKEVALTIIEATLIVILVIYLFLGSLRTVAIPIITIPLSLVGVCIFILMLGYSINLLTLLALVLSIGMVVDDAIVVVENIYRHIEEGMSPIDAAMQGAREIALPIIAMTITLAAVYAPIGFMGGVTGALFKEFAFTLASAVIISGIIALTLSPMMSSRILSAEISKQKFVHYIDEQFNNLKNIYQRWLRQTLHSPSLILIFAFVVLISCMFLYLNSKQELAPDEDQGAVFVMAQGPQTASLKYMETYTNQFDKIYQKIPSREDYFNINGMEGTNVAFSAIILKPWSKRNQTTTQVNQIVQNELNNITGLQGQAFGLPALPTGGSPIPIDFVLTTTQPFEVLYPLMEKLEIAAQKSGLFLFIMGGLKFDKPQIQIDIDMDKALQLGIDMKSIATNLAAAFGGNNVNSFSAEGRSYEVIPRADQKFQMTPNDILRVHINTASGTLVPLSTIAKIRYTNQPNSLTRFQQLNSASMQGMMMPGHTLGEGLNFLSSTARELLPPEITFDYGGQSRQFIQESGGLLFTFFFSIIVIFLVLAAQFESFRDPLVIMLSVPMAICGALFPINWGFASINIYTQVGLITLIGLISKHGILMVDFANKIRMEEGLAPIEAIEKAAAIRLRPILMTTFAMILGVVPLLTASGAGAVSRYNIGLVIASGMAIGTLFTLFVVPTMYTLKSKNILYFLLSVFLTAVFLYYLFYIIL